MKKSKELRAAIYHRVSTTDQDPILAREELRGAAQARGLVVALEVEEKGRDARNDRPGLQRIMTAAKKGTIDVLIVWKLDRWGRSALDLLANIRQLEDCGVRFIAATQGIDIKPDGDPMSKLLVTMLAAVAEFERDLVIERTRLGLAKARKRGKRLGRPLSRSAPSPKAVLRLRASGTSWRLVAEQLGCTPSAARRAVARLAEKGVPQKEAKGC